MDTLTHALAGAAISDGWFRKHLGPMATPFSFLAAASPDADMVLYFVSAESAWANHRGYTHSLFPMLLAAPLLGYIGYLLSHREGDWRKWSILALLCLFSHTFIDLVTSWGTMPFLPFSRARISWDVAPVLDVFMFAILAASFVLNRLLRWEKTETPSLNPLAYPIVHKHPKRRRFAMWSARVVVALALLYLGVGWRQNRQTVRVAREALAKQGISPVEVRALPVMFTYIAWEIAARDADGTVYNGVHSSYAPKPMEFFQVPTLPRKDLGEILSTREGDMFAWYSQEMYVASREKVSDGDGERIRLTDRRFWGLAKPHSSRFIMDFQKGDSGVWQARRAAHAPLTRGDLRDEFQRLWRLTWRGELDEESVADADGESSVTIANDS